MFYKCINLIKLTILHNKEGFIIVNNKKNIEVLKIFIKLNIIKFIKIDGKRIIVWINYINGKPIFKNIVNLYKPGHIYTISLKNLKKVSYNHNWILILSTNKGLMNNFEALRNNVSGVLVAKIWN